jgi:diguanylate cyclase (GGDEF)-like protein
MPSEAERAQEEEFLNPVVRHLHDVLAEAQRVGDAVALLLVHSATIDRVDALHGYHIGDRMSAAIADLLRAKALRKVDTIEVVARDEFACILRPASSEGIAMLAAQRVLTLFALPIDFGGTVERADVAVGIAMFPQHAQNARDLLQRAKQALRSAREHRDRLALYVPQHATPAIDQQQLEQRLRLAIERNTLTLFFQPQARLRTRRLTGAEALLRWHDDVLGPVPAYVAVQAAEAAGIIDQLTLWVITTAIQACTELQKVEPAFTVSVNISPSSLREADFPYYVDRALRTWGVAGHSLTVEITETAMIIDQTIANEALRELKRHDVRLAIDDFGTGYSSMSYLAQLPLDELKIDMMFVKGMLEVPHHAKIVRSLIELAHNLELSVVAEGVESEAVADALAHLGCDYGQGYYFGRAASAEDLIARLVEQSRDG